MVHLSPGIRAVEPYPFEELDRRKAAAVATGRRLIDLGIGDPQDETPSFIREALVRAIEPASSYPRAAGLPELRSAIADWVGLRYSVTLDPSEQIIPTLGSKEPIFALAGALLDPAAGKDTVLVTAPGYTVPERGARYLGAKVVRLPLVEGRDFLPDLESVDSDTWRRVAVLWLNYPNNPTGAVAPVGFLEETAERCRAADAVLASDEAYGELWFDEPTASVLQLSNLAHVLALHTLSKRSHMTGYRSGFAAGDPALVGALKTLGPSVGVTPQEFVQRASVEAWSDEAHVARHRAGYAAKRRVFQDLFGRHGVHVAGSVATFYLWVEVPGGRTSVEWAFELLDRGGVVVIPGSFFGPEGEGYVRIATVPSLGECERAAEIIDHLLSEVPA